MPPMGAAHDRYRSPIPGPRHLTRGGVLDRRRYHPGSSDSHRSTVPPRLEYPPPPLLPQRLTTMTPHRTRHRTLDHLSGQTAVLTSTVPIGQRPLFCPAEPRATPLC